ncbi:hypothetical protein THRCLA_12049, partial [Thraustotheca clavata]
VFDEAVNKRKKGMRQQQVPTSFSPPATPQATTRVPTHTSTPQKQEYSPYPSQYDPTAYQYPPQQPLPQYPMHQPPSQPFVAQNEQYADAYARAYAYAMAQNSGSSMPQYPMPPQPQAACPYGCHSHGNSFPSMQGVSPIPPMTSDDDLSKLLLSWYQSGYYAGRYKAIQEMKAAQFRR